MGEKPNPVKDRFVVTREFPFAGRWVVHMPGANRPHKIVALETEEETERVAGRLNAWIESLTKDTG